MEDKDGVFLEVSSSNNGQCFLCLNEANRFSSIHSLRYLSRCMKYGWVNKLLNEMGGMTINSESFINVNVEEGEKGSEVKLCEECANLNKKVMELHRQLEKIAMEMANCLGEIDVKLGKAKVTRRFPTGFTDTPADDDDVKPVVGGVGEILETSQKCSNKSPTGSPRVNVNLQKEITIKIFPASSGHHHQSSSTSAPEIDLSNVKLETSPHHSMFDEFGNDYSNELIEFGQPHSSTSSVAMVKADLDEWESEEAMMEQNDDFVRTPHPITSKPEYRKDPETGKFKCSLCPADFQSWKGFRYHHDSVHLQLRYECVICGQEFRSSVTHNNHYQSAHTGISPNKCDHCGKGYSTKSNLTIHQRICTGVVKPESQKTCNCHICGKGFATGNHLRRHFNSVHMQLQDHVCGHCGMKFSRKDHLARHVRRKHSKKVG